eukprot:TRINITY_DN17051_c0_g1_i1.p1 TRINITY_DN17051_c0_g1~~TRINITY_DN17051_c0_g1_i1.p1  ORF type:complete len:326 (+),score=45.93 TRINITY_DN17051_c0_g1_i1:80-1057(+)
MLQRLVCFSVLSILAVPGASSADGMQNVFDDVLSADDACSAKDPRTCDLRLLQQRGIKTGSFSLEEDVENTQSPSDKIDSDYLEPTPMPHEEDMLLRQDFKAEDEQVPVTAESLIQEDGQDEFSKGFTVYWKCETSLRNKWWWIYFGTKGTIIGRSKYKSDPLLVKWEGADSAPTQNAYPESYNCVTPDKPNKMLANGFWIGAKVYYKCKSHTYKQGFQQKYGNDGMIIGRSKYSYAPALVHWNAASGVKGVRNSYPEYLSCLSLSPPNAAAQAAATVAPTLSPTRAPAVTTTPNWGAMMDPSMWSDPNKLNDMMKKWGKMFPTR